MYHEVCAAYLATSACGLNSWQVMIAWDGSIWAWHRNEDYAAPTVSETFFVKFVPWIQIFPGCGGCSTRKLQGKKFINALTVLVYGSSQLVRNRRSK